MAIEEEKEEEEEAKPCTIVLHDDRVTRVDILAGNRVLHVGEFAWLTAPGARKLCIAPAGLAINSTEVSIHISLAARFGFENRTQGRIQIIEDVDSATATHVELFFRDQLLSRADMWQLMGCVQDTVIYQGQILNYLDTECAEVKQVYIAGREVESAISIHPHTKPIFRSGCARYAILVEISQEMLENWTNGELMYERLVDGFLPELFQRWESLKVKHQVSIICFGRIRTAAPQGKRDSQGEHPGEDFFHVLKSEGASSSWQHIVRKVKKALNDYHLPRNVSLAAESNILEAIHLTALDYADDQTDAYLMSTGTSIIAVTAGAGLFEADHTLLKQTTDLLVGNSIGVDIVALASKPLHPVPLFKYEHAGITEYALPHWVDISFWKQPHDVQASTWALCEPNGPVNDISLPVLRESNWGEVDGPTMDYHDNEVFEDKTGKASEALQMVNGLSNSDPTGSVETMKGVPIAVPMSRQSPKKHREPSPPPPPESPTSSITSPVKETVNRPERQRPKPHPLMQIGRKISVGPKGLAPSRGVASTTVSVTYAQQNKDVGPGSFMPSDTSSGLARAIRASLAKKPSQQSLASRVSNPDEFHSQPIAINAGNENSRPEIRDPASDVEQKIADTMVGTVLENDTSLSATPKAGHLFARKGSLNDTLDMLSPWVMLLNPCNPRRDNMKVASQYRKWQHVFPRAVSRGSFKWSSMCMPAALPLTAEYKPSASELETHYVKKVRRHVLSNSSSLKDEAARILVERLIDVRLIRGWQIVTIRNSGSDQTYQTQNKPTLMSLGRHYHEVQRLSDFEVQIVQYQPKAGIGSVGQAMQHYLTSYEPKLRTVTGMNAKPEITYHQEADISDWSPLDEYILGLGAMPDLNVAFKVRFVLIPIDMNKSNNSRLGGLSDEERRIEGIQRLTQTWQRQRYYSTEDQQHQVSLTKAKNASTTERDPNPLAIDYQTKDASIVINAHGPLLATPLEDGELSTPLFMEAEKHHSSNFDSAKLVKQMQELPPYGVEMRDRRWLTLTHLKCFRGDEMTTWLLSVFKDLEYREDAVAIGNELMSRGIFTHVRQKHKFRDGHYFYQISSAHRTTDYPDTQGFFSKAPWKSVPATPVAESMKSPALRPVSGDSSSSSSHGTPITGPADTKQILLSQMMLYNVDPQRKSDHLQVVKLHYDRIHNPENCYHIQLEWLVTSTKLVRDAISRWTGVVDGYGLKLVQVPLEEASKFREHHPFDQPQPIKLALRPPDKNVLQTPVIEPHNASQRQVEDRLAYYKALLRKLGFAMDNEAASSFKPDLNVTYSYGPPTYTYTQFVHNSGLVLAQITDQSDSSDFLLLPNRLASSRISSSSKNTEGDLVESIIKDFKAFCRDEVQLKKFYTLLERPRGRTPRSSPFFSPNSQGHLAADVDVPPMQLPQHLLHRTGQRWG
ncbi:vacuolar membrane-associated IML1 [Lecanosticta acicola]|uniref:Vacuolar membrane-associated protein IML1 n=1 Tax=Lecanosticta acicola TaxID=111012 RepID=A0AAI8YU18_9PEZI|nr:vacuolar membrane-associated IML1 [Lecanosticta acicola]